MTRTEMLEKVRKLLALAGSDNEHEAAAAAARAASIMERYEIEAADLGNLDDEPEEIEETTFDDHGGRLTRWRAVLASILAQASGCAVYTVGGRIQIVGKPSDVERAGILFRYCREEIERLAIRHARGQGRAYANAYRHGCVSAIGTSIRQEAAKTQRAAQEAGNTSALVLVDRQKAANTHMHQVHGSMRASRSQVSSAAGLRAGRADGAAIYGGRSRVGAGRYIGG